MEAKHAASHGRNLALVEPVRCLECGAIYSKPAGGGTVKANPGCPECGYLGWLSASIPINEEALRRRSDEDRRRRHSA